MKLRRFYPYFFAVLAFMLTVRIIPVSWCARAAAKWMNGNLKTQESFARGVERIVLHNDLARSDFNTGWDQFNGEWLFGTYLMAGIGFGQMALERPEIRMRHSELMSRCIEKILSKEVRAFDAEMWGEDPIDGIEGDHAHAAYLGYLNLLLGLRRLATGESDYAELNDRITNALIRHMNQSPILLIESYPGETYPVDNCFVIGSIGIHGRVTGADHGELIQKWIAHTREKYVDPKTGLLIQSVNASDGSAYDAPRGSGTALGLFAVHYADPEFARDLYRGIKKTLARSFLGFGVVREYPEGAPGRGDIDSGPIVLGYGLSATGFTIAGARMNGDAKFFRRLFATTDLFGAPAHLKNRREYVSGGAIGNAILFAMMTAPKALPSIQGESQ
ncbi:hypothetical protein JW926_11965 [Candidatus Sumerlaeota bacterium]|nr:hypothetical protein [Candidatus Sumerlaeota bacterium]